MVSISFVSLVLAAVANAVPLSEPGHKLAHGEMLLVGQNGTEVISQEAWHKLVEERGYLPEPPAWNQSWIDDANHLKMLTHNESTIEKRDNCDHVTAIITDKVERFVNWDVQMSPVVIGYGTGMDVTITKSYTVSNSVTVSAGLDLNIIKHRLSSSLGVSLDRTWTTAQGYLIRGNVQDGETGVVITTPWTNRRSGRVFQGCMGNQRMVGTWIADTYEDGAYEGVSWVGGAITVCGKKQRGIPLSRCHGQGDFR
ncbi:hypothetical protein LZ30DRAFT_694525 [Colletotrichum cereale]|nr:hypothetical protein LZ30DRAFT_694525 [Colletotrichum cereale]